MQHVNKKLGSVGEFQFSLDGTYSKLEAVCGYFARFEMVQQWATLTRTGVSRSFLVLLIVTNSLCSCCVLVHKEVWLVGHYFDFWH